MVEQKSTSQTNDRQLTTLYNTIKKDFYKGVEWVQQQHIYSQTIVWIDSKKNSPTKTRSLTFKNGIQEKYFKAPYGMREYKI